MSKYYAIFVYVPPNHPYRAKVRLEPRYDTPVLCSELQDKFYTSERDAKTELFSWQNNNILNDASCYFLVEVDSEELLP